MSMRQNDLVKGGTEACAIIGYGNRWYEPGQVRFMDDEPVRHKMLDLIVSSSKPHILLLNDLYSTLDSALTGCIRRVQVSSMSWHVCAIVNLFLTSMHGMVRADMSIVKSAIIKPHQLWFLLIMASHLAFYLVCFAELVTVQQLKSWHGCLRAGNCSSCFSFTQWYHYRCQMCMQIQLCTCTRKLT